MTAADLSALLDNMGYTAIQAADAAPCGRSTMFAMLQGTRAVSPVIAASLTRHAKLLRIAEAVRGRRRVPTDALDDRVPEPRPVGRPKRAA
jgi:hypothetical protein